MRTLGCLMLSGCVMGLVACGPGDGHDAAAAAAGDAGAETDSRFVFENDTSPATDAGTTPTTDSGPPGCADSGVDELDDDGLDTNCDGADGVVGKDVYVDGVSGADTNPGTPTKPKRTIDAALKVALAQSGAVVLSAGTYQNIESIERAGTWRIVGGYGAGFSGKPKRELTTLEASSPAGMLIGPGAKATIAHLTIVGASPTSISASTAQALRTRAELLVLDDVVVRAADGRAGAHGKTGVVGADGKPGDDGWGTATKLECGAVLQPAFSFGAEMNAQNAEGKLPGDYVLKRIAGNGSNGTEGSDGADAAKTPLVKDDVIVWASAGAGLANGTPGYGGAGGGGNNPPYTMSAGGGGTGGCPGGGGEGASSGGGSIAVVVLSGELQIARSVIATGFGGDGGAGGPGGVGGVGGIGGKPTSDVGTCADCEVARVGGKGGNGGRGGRGGGGAGGWTIGVVSIGTAAAKVDGATVFQLGKPGAGGLGNAGGYAPSGEKRTTFSM